MSIFEDIHDVSYKGYKYSFSSSGDEMWDALPEVPDSDTSEYEYVDGSLPENNFLINFDTPVTKENTPYDSSCEKKIIALLSRGKYNAVSSLGGNKISYNLSNYIPKHELRSALSQNPAIMLYPELASKFGKRFYVDQGDLCLDITKEEIDKNLALKLKRVSNKLSTNSLIVSLALNISKFISNDKNLTNEGIIKRKKQASTGDSFEDDYLFSGTFESTMAPDIIESVNFEDNDVFDLNGVDTTDNVARFQFSIKDFNVNQIADILIAKGVTKGVDIKSFLSEEGFNALSIRVVSNLINKKLSSKPSNYIVQKSKGSSSVQFDMEI